MWTTGLVTVSFRPLSPQQVATLAAGAGLAALEWGGDVHVPPNDPENARKTAALTADAGLKTAAYGSYYRLGTEKDPKEAFARVLETACLLDAPVIRLWGGRKGSKELTEAEWAALAAEGRTLTEMARAVGRTLSLECHVGTLTDDYMSALRFLHDVPDMTMYWQPNQFHDEVYNRAAAAALAPVTTNIHVFQWDEHARYPLAEGEALWRDYVRPFTGQDHALLLEFMHDDRPESLPETAKTLRRIAAAVNGEENVR